MSPYVNEDYRKILRAFFATKKARSGIKSEFANHLEIKTSYLSQVLSDKAHLSLEQVFSACQFFEWNEKETEYMLLCAQKDKAKNAGLTTFYLNQLRQIKTQEHASEIHNKYVESEETSQLYYACYLTPSIHITLKNMGPQSRDWIIQKFEDSKFLIEESLNVLVSLGLVQVTGTQYNSIDIKVPLPKQPVALERYYKSCREFSLFKAKKKSFHTEWITKTANQTEAIEKVIKENIAAIQSTKNDSVWMINLDFTCVASTEESE